jgi:hypothetical protein
LSEGVNILANKGLNGPQEFVRHVERALLFSASDFRVEPEADALWVCLHGTSGGRGVGTTAAWRVLIIGAEANRHLVIQAMQQWTLDAVSCSSLQEARGLLPDLTFSIIFCEETLVDGTYLDVINVLGKPLRARLVVISPSSYIDETYQAALTAGAFDMITSPCRPSDVQWMVIRAIREESRHSGRRGRG